MGCYTGKTIMVGSFLMNQLMWNFNLWYMLVVVLTTSWHWLQGTILVFDLFDSWHNSSFKSKKGDSRFIQIYSSASSKYKTWFISKLHFSTKHSTFHYKKPEKKQIHKLHPHSISCVSPKHPSVRVAPWVSLELWMSCSILLTNTKPWSC